MEDVVYQIKMKNGGKHKTWSIILCLINGKQKSQLLPTVQI